MNTTKIERKSISPGGKESVAPTRPWMTCDLNPRVGEIFHF